MIGWNSTQDGLSCILGGILVGSTYIYYTEFFDSIFFSESTCFLSVAHAFKSLCRNPMSVYFPIIFTPFATKTSSDQNTFRKNQNIIHFEKKIHHSLFRWFSNPAKGLDRLSPGARSTARSIAGRPKWLMECCVKAINTLGKTNFLTVSAQSMNQKMTLRVLN